MGTEKIDPRLHSEIERLERSGVSSERLPVLIETVDVSSGSMPRDVDALERDVAATQESLRQRLAGMDAVNVRQLTLARALVAQLTPHQIREVAEEPSVKRLLLNTPENVTL